MKHERHWKTTTDGVTKKSRETLALLYIRGEMTTAQIAKYFGTTGSTVSQRLRSLRTKGLVIYRRCTNVGLWSANKELALAVLWQQQMKADRKANKHLKPPALPPGRDVIGRPLSPLAAANREKIVEYLKKHGYASGPELKREIGMTKNQFEAAIYRLRINRTVANKRGRGYFLL